MKATKKDVLIAVKAAISHQYHMWEIYKGVEGGEEARRDAIIRARTLVSVCVAMESGDLSSIAQYAV